jgi:hypothetical protein
MKSEKCGTYFTGGIIFILVVRGATPDAKVFVWLSIYNICCQSKIPALPLCQQVQRYYLSVPGGGLCSRKLLPG